MVGLCTYVTFANAVAASALAAVVAFVALVALVALVAFVAESAVLAWSALGTTRVDFSFLEPIEPGAILPLVTAFLAIFFDVTAPFLSCLVPTLFFARVAPAYAVPAIATTSAAIATISPAPDVGRCHFLRRCGGSPSGDAVRVSSRRIDEPPVLMV